jgi:hypothetical protein
VGSAHHTCVQPQPCCPSSRRPGPRAAVLGLGQQVLTRLGSCTLRRSGRSPPEIFLWGGNGSGYQIARAGTPRPRRARARADVPPSPAHSARGQAWDSCHAGLTSPALRRSTAISSDESALTALVSRSGSSAKCFLVASTAFSEAAIATLKYLKDGASGKVPARGLPVVDCVDCAGIVTWTTQPVGATLPVMHGNLVRFGI